MFYLGSVRKKEKNLVQTLADALPRWIKHSTYNLVFKKQAIGKLLWWLESHY